MAQFPLLNLLSGAKRIFVGLQGKKSNGDFTDVTVTDGGAINVALTGSKVEEQKTESDATSNVITFSEPIQSIEIYHDEATPQTFVVNGLSLKIASGGWRSPVGGTPSTQVTIPAGVSCIVSRLV